MKKLFLILAISFTAFFSSAQTTAMDFNMNDCNGNMHHLYSELDNGEVVILEFFMNCASCITAGQKITPMYNNLAAQYPGMVHYYAITYNNTMTCTQATSWTTTNGINAIPFDSGAVQVAYYGGFGMPTIAVVAGNQHSVLFTNVGFTINDTTTMGNAIRNFFLTSVPETNATISSVEAFPNPATNNVQVNFEMLQNSAVTVQLVNTLGQVVKEIPSGNYTPGKHNTTISVSDLKAGAYFIRLSTNNGVVTRRILISE